MATRVKFSYSRDGNSVILLEPTNFQTSDATGTPVQSPSNANSTTGLTLLVPYNALAVQITVSTAAYVGKSMTNIATIGIPLAANQTITLPCSGISTLCFQASSTTASVSFIFWTTETVSGA